MLKFSKIINLRGISKMSTNKSKLTSPQKRKQLSEQKQIKRSLKAHKGPTQSQLNVLLTQYKNGQYPEAERSACFLSLHYPRLKLSWAILAALYLASDRLLQALSAFKKLAKLAPEDYEAQMNVGLTQQQIGQLSAAEASFRRVIRLNPTHSKAFHHLGKTLQFQNKLEQAIKSFEQSIKLTPDFAGPYRYLGSCLMLQRKWGAALIHLETAKRFDPNLEYLLGDIMFAKKQLCQYDNFELDISELKKKIDSRKKVSVPFYLNALIDDPYIIKKGTEIYSNHQYPKPNSVKCVFQYKNHQKIIVGYFSSDFRNHPLAKLIVDLFKNHNRENFEVHAFSLSPVEDEWTLRTKDGVDYFHNCFAKSDQEICDLSRLLELDIAIDLNGFTAQNRQGVFALSAAPVQIGYLGFVGTTGSEYYDYLISDQTIVPRSSQRFYTEKMIYLPSYQVNSSLPSTPDRALDKFHFDIPENSFVFCCFAGIYKIDTDLLDSWSRILNQVPDSVLFLYTDNDQSIRNLQKQFCRRGVVASRLIFGGHLKGPEYWSKYAVCDLFLDPFLLNGGSTGSDALRSGCPVITCMGSSFGSRLGGSLLTSLDLPELISTTKNQYEALAVDLATNPRKLHEIRKKLLANLPKKPLYDTRKFVASVEMAYIKAHKRFHNNEPIDHIYI